LIKHSIHGLLLAPIIAAADCAEDSDPSEIPDASDALLQLVARCLCRKRQQRAKKKVLA